MELGSKPTSLIMFSILFCRSFLSFILSATINPSSIICLTDNRGFKDAYGS